VAAVAAAPEEFGAARALVLHRLQAKAEARVRCEIRALESLAKASDKARSAKIRVT
jgi:hypothetical protein